MRIYLTGFMGAGKSAVGQALADLLGVPFVDLDAEVETRAGLSVRQIFESAGEAAFRDLEYQALRATAALENAIVATGGGTITFERNLAFLRQAGVSIWLNPSFQTIADRIGGRGKLDRPLFQSEEQAFELYRHRLDAYRRADLDVAIGPEETPREVAARIHLLLRERVCVI
ncbi:MAG: shikimate kinase [Thermoanaerobaculia bacterium]|nr:shikimate kinase [Thermoanaerobaculia bacterium]